MYFIRSYSAIRFIPTMKMAGDAAIGAKTNSFQNI
jgi:hypothetical protein